MDEKDIGLTEEQLAFVYAGNTREGAAEFASKNDLTGILNDKTVEELKEMKIQLEGIEDQPIPDDDQVKMTR